MTSMKIGRRAWGAVTAIVMSLLLLGLALPAGDASAQQKAKPLQQELVGTWLLTSIYNEYQDGSKVENFGRNVKGTAIYDRNGRFSWLVIGEVRPELVSDDPRRPDAPLVAYYGTYSVNEENRVITYNNEEASHKVNRGVRRMATATIEGDKLKLVTSPLQDKKGTFVPHIELIRAK